MAAPLSTRRPIKTPFEHNETSRNDEPKNDADSYRGEGTTRDGITDHDPNEIFFRTRSKEIKNMVRQLKQSIGKSDRQVATKVNKLLTKLQQAADDLYNDYNKIPDDRKDKIEEIDRANRIEPSIVKPGDKAVINNVNTDPRWGELGVVGKYYYFEDEDKHQDDKTEITPLVAKTIERRLRQCFDMEGLYIDKHNELLDLFKFAINLFKKYNYSIKLVLYLLKHLVYQGILPTIKDPDPLTPTPKRKPPPKSDCPTIKIPKSVINNIKILLQDQNSMKNTWGKLKNNLGKLPNSLKNLGTDDETELVHGGIPPDLALPKKKVIRKPMTPRRLGGLVGPGYYRPRLVR